MGKVITQLILLKNLSILLLSFCFLIGCNCNSTSEPTDKIENVAIEQEYQRWSSIRDDWPNFKRYRTRNSQLAAPLPKENRVVFMGNSITDAWSNIVPSFFKGKPYINSGISGQTTPQMLVRFTADVIDLQPKVVVLLCGTNDIAGNTGIATQKMITDNIAAMAMLANANGIKVVLSSILPVYDYPWKKGIQPAEKIIAINKWMVSYASKNNFTFLDYFSALANERNGMKSSYSKDGVHPNLAGYIIMGELAEKAIDKALN